MKLESNILTVAVSFHFRKSSNVVCVPQTEDQDVTTINFDCCFV